jgi:XapX domain-containing protein
LPIRLFNPTEIMKELIALLIAFGIGALCGRYHLPLPAPPHWFGVLLIVAIWGGYMTFRPGS